MKYSPTCTMASAAAAYSRSTAVSLMRVSSALNTSASTSAYRCARPVVARGWSLAALSHPCPSFNTHTHTHGSMRGIHRASYGSSCPPHSAPCTWLAPHPCAPLPSASETSLQIINTGPNWLQSMHHQGTWPALQGSSQARRPASSPLHTLPCLSSDHPAQLPLTAVHDHAATLEDNGLPALGVKV